MASFEYVEKRLKAKGIELLQSEGREDSFYGYHLGYVISFFARRGENVPHLYVRRWNSHDDIQSDYFAGEFCDNVKQAVELVGRLGSPELEAARVADAEAKRREAEEMEKQRALAREESERQAEADARELSALFPGGLEVVATTTNFGTKPQSITERRGVALAGYVEGTTAYLQIRDENDELFSVIYGATDRVRVVATGRFPMAERAEERAAEIDRRFPKGERIVVSRLGIDADKPAVSCGSSRTGAHVWLWVESEQSGDFGIPFERLEDVQLVAKKPSADDRRRAAEITRRFPVGCTILCAPVQGEPEERGVSLGGVADADGVWLRARGADAVEFRLAEQNLMIVSLDPALVAALEAARERFPQGAEVAVVFGLYDGDRGIVHDVVAEDNEVLVGVLFEGETEPFWVFGPQHVYPVGDFPEREAEPAPAPAPAPEAPALPSPPSLSYRIEARDVKPQVVFSVEDETLDGARDKFRDATASDRITGNAAASVVSVVYVVVFKYGEGEPFPAAPVAAPDLLFEFRVSMASRITAQLNMNAAFQEYTGDPTEETLAALLRAAQGYRATFVPVEN